MEKKISVEVNVYIFSLYMVLIGTIV